MGKRFIMNAGRSTRQGELISLGKDHREYLALVQTLTMHADDMIEVGVKPGGKALVRSAHGEGVFRCQPGNVPSGMVFVVYGPPSSALMGTATDGTGTPNSKGWDVDLDLLDAP